MNYIEALQQRYSVKKFNLDKKVPNEVLCRILEAGRLSASSLGLQPYMLYVVENKGVLDQLQSAFHNQSQISTCSHLIVISTKKRIEEQYLNNYFDNISKIRNVELEALNPFRDSINYYIGEKGDVNLLNWNEKQSYILLGNLIFAAAMERVDTCPMEGFLFGKIEEILGLDLDVEQVSVTLALGYRAEDDVFQTFKKVRKPNEDLIKFI